MAHPWEQRAEDLHFRYGWGFWGRWSQPETDAIARSGLRIAEFVSLLTGMNGEAWVRKYLGNTIFVHFIGKYSLVFPKRHIFLIKGFADKVLPEAHVTHELAHVLDNNLGGFFPSTFIGGGPADALICFLNGNPKKTSRKVGGLFNWRWYGGINLPAPQDCWHPASLYGNNSYADYFAEAFAWSVHANELSAVPWRAGEWLRANLGRWSI